MTEKEKVVGGLQELRKKWDEARNDTQPAHAAVVGIEAIVSFLETIILPDQDDDSEAPSLEAGAGQSQDQEQPAATDQQKRDPGQEQAPPGEGGKDGTSGNAQEK